MAETPVRLPALPGGTASVRLVYFDGQHEQVIGFEGHAWAMAYQWLDLSAGQIIALTPTAAIATADGRPTGYQVTVKAPGVRHWEAIIQVPDSVEIQELDDLVGAAAIDPDSLLAGRLLPAQAEDGQSIVWSDSDGEWVATSVAPGSGIEEAPATGGPYGRQGLTWVEVTGGVGVPTGGTTGQVLAKNSNTNYDTEWVAEAGATGDAFATSHLTAFDHGNIANGQTAYGWGNHASAGYLTSVTNHDHAGNKLTQTNTHESPDTDSATTALHHTIGTGANQAAAGNHTHAASAIASGTIATARLGSGTADSTTYLRGDNTWAAVSGGSATQAFGTVSVSGQSDVVADAAPDTLTLVAGSNITITTNASADSITIAASGGATNLSVTNKTGTSLDIASDTGADATIPAATGTDAGLMTAAQYTKLSGIEASASAAGATGDAFAASHPGGNQHIDWTADQGATNVHSGNIPDLSATYATAAKGVTNGDSHDHSGGDGAQISYSGLSNIPSSFTPAAHASSHSTGQADAISPANIGAEPTQTAASQDDAEAGSVTSIRSFTPQRIFQAIAAKVAAMFGTTAGTVCQGNDSRLSDSRTPTSHDHSSNKLAQANTHESADTDSATSSLHHTIGTGANNAAAGNHTHGGGETFSAFLLMGA